jgi:hypothetical protein
MGVNVFKYMSFGAMFAELDIGEPVESGTPS